MLSRVADSIYWLNRYIERAENVARFVEVNLNLLLDLPMGLQEQWQPLVTTTGDRAVFESRYSEFTADAVMQFLTFDAEYDNSILSCVRAARTNARSVREAISSAMWEQVNDFYLMVTEAARSQESHWSLSAISDFLAQVKRASHSFNGVMDATMTHSEGWNFGCMGRYLERADKTSRILDVKYYLLLPTPDHVGSPLDELGWMALLKSASAYEMYRKSLSSYQHRITPAGVAAFLILDIAFPRSIRFCLLEAERSLHAITGSPLGFWQNDSERTLGRLRSELEYATIEEILHQGMHEFLDRLQLQMNTVDRTIFETFFSLEPIMAQSQ
ncbi:alpha-E domain-containing protein [Lyngbya confervoides]|uniref:Alpha-E domain-containing protein n=1 Tax=Lyngbya confervoides BDU141951 TaxID=1574623 RepID=A0ABD4T8U1_9CYAN|nr:alpha-E domain-containing protein [Lyngbya confervoides]MCM1984700.1 alpha-E domain-containing protein [Lyngbya confervoides BDU141951]